MSLLKTLKSLFSKKDPAAREMRRNSGPSFADVVPTRAVEPAQPSAPAEPIKVSIPRLADAVIVKSVGKRQAFALVKAQYGTDGVAALTECLADARKRWLPIPGTLQRATDGTEYAVDKNGAMRRVSRLMDAARKVAA